MRQPDPEARRLPGTVLSQRFDVEVSVPATGVGRRPTGVAKGTVTFVNSRENVLVVPEGLVLVATNGLRFTTESEVRLPPNTLVGLPVGVHALEPGPAGNVPAMAITRLAEGHPPGLVRSTSAPRKGARKNSRKSPNAISSRCAGSYYSALMRRPGLGWQMPRVTSSPSSSTLCGSNR